MSYDLQGICEDLGIDEDDLSNGQYILQVLLNSDFNNTGKVRMKPYIDLEKNATRGQFIAVVRFDGLYKLFPEIFCWDGLNENATKEDIERFSEMRFSEM